MTLQPIAESSVVHCDCAGAILGDVEQMCEKCLDAYMDAVIQGASGPALVREVERVMRIVQERLQKDPDLAEDVRAMLTAQVALARPSGN